MEKQNQVSRMVWHYIASAPAVRIYWSLLRSFRCCSTGSPYCPGNFWGLAAPNERRRERSILLYQHIVPPSRDKHRFSLLQVLYCLVGLLILSILKKTTTVIVKKVGSIGDYALSIQRCETENESTIRLMMSLVTARCKHEVKKTGAASPRYIWRHNTTG